MSFESATELGAAVVVAVELGADVLDLALVLESSLVELFASGSSSDGPFASGSESVLFVFPSSESSKFAW